ncbi:1247_t:CDS:2 [Ambispora gerdemannii]|uniref:1247_t:CDS:1 n=1 Tax=Ambispora gerdemannii TaxID=144530 RepID=A0A9N9AQF5_9GLOM|nr:1247_t:CDS:2 [Ambispora gerdemannii]
MLQINNLSFVYIVLTFILIGIILTDAASQDNPDLNHSAVVRRHVDRKKKHGWDYDVTNEVKICGRHLKRDIYLLTDAKSIYLRCSELSMPRRPRVSVGQAPAQKQNSMRHAQASRNGKTKHPADRQLNSTVFTV